MKSEHFLIYYQNYIAAPFACKVSFTTVFWSHLKNMDNLLFHTWVLQIPNTVNFKISQKRKKNKLQVTEHWSIWQPAPLVKISEYTGVFSEIRCQKIALLSSPHSEGLHFNVSNC